MGAPANGPPSDDAMTLQEARAILAEHRRVEQELAAERERLQITLASIGDGVISTDAEGRVVFLNAVAEALTGWRQADAAGRPLTEVFRIVNETTRQTVENPAMRALAEGIVVGLANHTILIARDGTERMIDDSAAPMRDAAGATLGAVLVFRDITEQRLARVAQARLAAIVEGSDDAIVSKTLDGVIRSWNRGAERLFGYSEAEAVGHHITLIIPPELASEENDILARLRRGERIDHYETVRLTKDGRPLDISLTVSPIHDDEGHVIAASKIARDVTDRKRMERELRQRAEELAAADQRKDEFIALLAHELRNPLAPLRTGLEVMRLAAGDAAALERVRTMMERHLSHLVRLIDDLLEVSRLNQNKLHLQLRPVLLADVVSHAVEVAAPAIEAAGHELTVSVPDAPIRLEADLTRLAQVFGNLLTNSAKYTEPGGRIWLTATRQGDEVVVSVRDTGIGLPRDALPGIFELFSQVDRPTEKITGGLGIGLGLVRAIVERHGGSVRAESPGPDQGSTFTVRLPVVDAPEEVPVPAPAVAGATPAQALRLRVLLVDDNRDAAESLAEALALLGHEVHTAHDGLQAVERAEELRPDLIVMDLGLPGIGGLEATRRIRSRPWARDVRIVALTGWGQERDRERSREAGCDSHLVKPVGIDDLERVVRELWGGS